ncbi:Ycf66 family protein [Phormidesmis priestleyi]
MVNYQFSITGLLGLILVLVGLFLPLLELILYRGSRVEKLLQDLVLSPLYFLIGLILVFYGWRFDPIMQLGQVLLVSSNLYWIVRDHRS